MCLYCSRQLGTDSFSLDTDSRIPRGSALRVHTETASSSDQSRSRQKHTPSTLSRTRSLPTSRRICVTAPSAKWCSSSTFKRRHRCSLQDARVRPCRHRCRCGALLLTSTRIAGTPRSCVSLKGFRSDRRSAYSSAAVHQSGKGYGKVERGRPTASTGAGA